MPNIDSQQFDSLLSLLNKSQKVLILLPRNPKGGAIGSGLALAGYLKKTNKQAEVICSEFDAENFDFLPGVSEIKRQTVFPRSFVISVNTSSAQLDEFSYDSLPDQIKIFLKPKQGTFSEKDVSFSFDSAGFDLIVCLNVPSLDALGELYEKNAETFFALPKVNIDNHINNENYGTINIVDVTSASVSEILFELFKRSGALIDEEIATNLLTGIVADTNSFQSTKTTPDSFQKSSELISLGAKQQEIIRHLFKTKELSVLKLWGRAMARIKPIQDFPGALSMLSVQDLQKSDAKESDIKKVAEDFMDNISDAKILFLLVEKTGYVEVYAGSNPNVKLQELVNYFGGSFISDNLAKFILQEKTAIAGETRIVSALNQLRSRLGV